MRLSSKVAIITGSGQGIGAATALKFAREGATVAVCDVNPEAIATVVQACRAAGAEAHGYTVDVTDRGAVDRMVADVLARWLLAPQELPVGGVTALLGGGYLLWLMHRRRL